MKKGDKVKHKFSGNEYKETCASNITEIPKKDCCLKSEENEHIVISNNTNVGGCKYNSGKLNWSLVDFASLESLVKVLEFGAKKYARDNWKKGLKFNDTVDSMIRHLIKFKEVGNNDEESGLCHLGHIMANAMFLEYMIKNNKGLDDRNLPKEDKIVDVAQTFSISDSPCASGTFPTDLGLSYYHIPSNTWREEENSLQIVHPKWWKPKIQD